MLGGFYKEAALFRLVGQVGLEPTMVKPADLQSTAIAARRLKPMVEPAGIDQRRLSFQSGAQPSAKSRFAVASGMLAAARIPTELRFRVG